MIVGDDIEASVSTFADQYRQYFEANTDGSRTMLDAAPRWAVWPGNGLVSFGANPKELRIIGDITEHTIKAIQQAQSLGGWKALPEADIFEMEYWELEQAKLKKAGSPPEFQGKVALVTGAASGIGKACVEALTARGAVVAALDLNPDVESMFDPDSVLGLVCDVTDQGAVDAAVEATVRRFGGLDILVSNAGFFPSNYPIAEMDRDVWLKSLDVNLTAHQTLMTVCGKYLELGVDPAVVIVGSKNVPAPGPGAAPYSVAKAGLAQLARIAALEWGGKGVRVNMVHPDAVYDTGIWTDEVLQRRANHYGMSVEDYKRRNVLKTEVAAADVGEMVSVLAGSTFSKVTGAQIPIDGGNERVI
jgi:NAD(P)-dependent dehydrogenase (short-subunit alcohol dehydrogenase family)